MPNVFDYLNWRADITFENSAPNEIDALIFSEFSYIPFDDIVPGLEDEAEITLREATDRFFASHGENVSLGAILPTDILPLLKQASRTPRFANVKMWGYVSETRLDVEKQFSAICFSFDKYTYVAFRGTDDTLVGWKEDLNMSLFTPIPSQKDGVAYLESVCKKKRGKIVVTGHSKGGNIAVYSALNCSTRLHKRIDQVYSFDGPGFMEEFISAYQDYDIVAKIKTILPSKSVVGRIFDIIGDCEIIKSSDKGVQQHDAFTWQLLGTEFVKATSFEKPSDNFHELLKLWVSKMSMEERHEFVDSFYKIATSSDASTLTDITNKKMQFIMGIIKSEGSNKKVVIEAVFKLIKEQNALTATKRAEAKKEKIARKIIKKGTKDK